MKTLANYIFPIMSLLLCSCNKNEAFSPPEAGSNISVAIQLPKSVEMLPLRAMYRSEICRKNKFNGAGDNYEEPGYKIMEVALKNVSKDKGFHVPIPMDGGGDCEWKLSNITFSFQSIQMNGASHSVPISEIVIFDKNPPQRISGSYQDIIGDLDLTGDYFPMVTTYHINGYKKVESIVRSTPDKMYRIRNKANINFHPKFHESKIIYAVEPKQQKTGEYMSITYPDGSVEASPYFPNYKKMQSLIESYN